MRPGPYNRNVAMGGGVGMGVGYGRGRGGRNLKGESLVSQVEVISRYMLYVAGCCTTKDHTTSLREFCGIKLFHVYNQYVFKL